MHARGRAGRRINHFPGGFSERKDTRKGFTARGKKRSWGKRRGRLTALMQKPGGARGENESENNTPAGKKKEGRKGTEPVWKKKRNFFKI